jgi:multidrug transporter EmrE-like cation transporter
MNFLPWLALILAALANLTTNISLKFVARNSSYAQEPLWREPWLWSAFFSGIALLACYSFAIRHISLGYCYAFVTSVTLILLTVTAGFIFQERLNFPVFTGIGLIVFGILILTWAEFADQ